MSADTSALKRVCNNLLPILAVTFKKQYDTVANFELYQLREQVGKHLQKYEAAQAKNSELEADLALELAGKIGELLTQYEDFTPQQQGLIVAAARYFVAEEDAMPDTDSRLGLDDDIAVFNAVVNELNLTDLVIYA